MICCKLRAVYNTTKQFLVILCHIHGKEQKTPETISGEESTDLIHRLCRSQIQMVKLHIDLDIVHAQHATVSDQTKLP